MEYRLGIGDSSWAPLLWRYSPIASKGMSPFSDSNDAAPFVFFSFSILMTLSASSCAFMRVASTSLAYELLCHSNVDVHTENKKIAQGLSMRKPLNRSNRYWEAKLDV